MRNYGDGNDVVTAVLFYPCDCKADAIDGHTSLFYHVFTEPAFHYDRNVHRIFFLTE